MSNVLEWLVSFLIVTHVLTFWAGFVAGRRHTK